MSIIQYQPGEADHGWAIQTWSGMAPGDEGVPIPVLPFGRASIEVSGDGAVEIQGRIRNNAKFSLLEDDRGRSSRVIEGEIFNIPNLIVVEIKPLIPKNYPNAKPMDVTILLKR